MERPRLAYLGRTDELAEILQRFTSRYANDGTRKRHWESLTNLFRYTARQHPSEVTETELVAWCTATPANNTAKSRISLCRTFWRWCVREGVTDSNPAEHLGDRDGPLGRITRTYGKVESKYPGRWLTHEEAYGRLAGGCVDGTSTGLRDAIAIRIALLAIRATEVVRLDWGNLTGDQLTWMGKGRKPRRATAGPTLIALLDQYRRAYEKALGRPVLPTDPILCGDRPGRAVRERVAYGKRMGYTKLFCIFRDRGQQAGLGHVAPHDAKRTNAAILHRAMTPEGGHRFDLLDIQLVQGHSDPATTMRCYLEPMEHGVQDRAATVLD